MGAKGFLVVWLAFSAPWVAGTGIGVYAESQGLWDDEPAISCSDRGGAGKSDLSGAGCREKEIASLTDQAVASIGRVARPGSSRAADRVAKTSNLTSDLMDGAFILAPPLLLFIVYCLFSFVAWISRSFGSKDADVEQGGES